MNLGELGTRIRSRREARGLRQADLAAAVRVSPQAVSKWERGENAPDISVLVPLSRLLDVSVEWLLGGAPSERETFEAVVFVSHVDCFAARAAEMPPRGLAAWINGVHLTVTEAVRALDGIPVKYAGDGFLAFFTGADHVGRGLEAARRAHASVDADGFSVVLHLGQIYLGTIGHPDYATPDILGEAVNTAFMLAPHVGARAPGGVLVTAALAAAAQDDLRFEAKGELTLGAGQLRIAVSAPSG